VRAGSPACQTHSPCQPPFLCTHPHPRPRLPWSDRPRQARCFTANDPTGTPACGDRDSAVRAHQLQQSPNLSDDSWMPRMQRQAIRQGSAVRAYSRRVVSSRISPSLPYSRILSTAALAPPHPILDCSTWSWTSSTNPCQISNKCSI
jgi:hypothetical protein